MTGAALLEVQQGKPLGIINYYQDGEVTRKIGDFNVGVIPEESVLASANTQAYIATSRVPEVGTEELVIALGSDKSGETTIDVGARVGESGEPISLDTDPELLEGALKIAMGRNHVIVARLAESSASLPEGTAQKFGLKKDELGAMIVRPATQFAVATPSSTW